MKIYRQEQTGEGWFPIPLYNLSLSNCIQNTNFLYYTVVGIYFTKNMERKKKKNKYRKNKYRKEQIREGSFSIPRYNLPCQPVYQIQSFYLEYFRDIFDKTYSTQCMERKKSDHIEGRTNRRGLVLYSTI